MRGQGRQRGWALPAVFVLACAGPAAKKDARGPADTGESAVPDPGDTDDTHDTDDSGDTGDTDDTWPSGARVLDHVTVVDASRVWEDAAVVLVGGEIHAITGAGQDWPADAVVDVFEDASVLPGLIDAHVHLSMSGVPWWVGDTLTENLSATLAWGVVAVADLGGPTGMLDLRDRIAAGEITGPRVWATGPFLTAPGSHPCETLADTTRCRFIDGDGAAAVAELDRADGIKVALTDAAFTAWSHPRLDLGDLAEITAAASMTVVAHTDTPDDVADAIAAGVGLLAHPVFSEVAATTAAPVTSTVGAFSGLEDLLDGTLLDEDMSHTPPPVLAAWSWLNANPMEVDTDWRAAHVEWTGNARGSLAATAAAGGTIMAGSDAGFSYVPHGLGLHRELAELVDAGMTPLEAIAAATAVPADFFGWSDLGFVDAGYSADLLVVQGRPDIDIRATRDILAVYQDGEPVRLDDPWVSAGVGDWCLDDRDCSGRCDQVHHRCGDTCAAYSPIAICGPLAWCAPVDGFAATAVGVCRAEPTCDLGAQDCEPEWYGSNCVPADLDTNVCWPSGPAEVGEVCSWSEAEQFCAQGLLCSQTTLRCIEMCDLDDPYACPGCDPVVVEGMDWFGLCP